MPLPPGPQTYKGIRRAVQLAFQGIDAQSRRPSRGGPRQLHPQGEGQQPGGGLVGRHGGGRQQHAFQVQGFAHLQRVADVPGMHRIEGSAQKPHPSPRRGKEAMVFHPTVYSRTWPRPRTTNLVVVSSRTPIGP